MKFTIYSGFYNNINYLNQIWEGIKNQTYDNWEWIIADDFSDNPEDAKILKEFANLHPNVKFVAPRWKKEFYYNPPVEHSTGEIMLVQDVDDYPSPKLLEVYKYHFEKFPNVEMVSCSSIGRHNSIKGDIAWYKQNDYSNFSNYYEAIYGSVKFPPLARALGEARAYRIKTNNPNEFCKEKDYSTYSEDMLKTFSVEKRGKILFLPRLLQTYSYDSPSSISHSKLSIDKVEQINEENKKMAFKIHGNNLEFLDSIEHYYDLSFNDINPLIFNPLYLENSTLEFDIWNLSLISRGKNRLKELYFDYKLNFNTFSSTSNCAFFEVSTLDNLKLLQENLKFYTSTSKNIVIHTQNEELHDSIQRAISKLGVGCWWFQWQQDRNYIINL